MPRLASKRVNSLLGMPRPVDPLRPVWTVALYAVMSNSSFALLLAKSDPISRPFRSILHHLVLLSVAPLKCESAFRQKALLSRDRQKYNSLSILHTTKK